MCDNRRTYFFAGSRTQAVPPDRHQRRAQVHVRHETVRKGGAHLQNLVFGIGPGFEQVMLLHAVHTSLTLTTVD